MTPLTELESLYRWRGIIAHYIGGGRGEPENARLVRALEQCDEKCRELRRLNKIEERIEI